TDSIFQYIQPPPLHLSTLFPIFLFYLRTPPPPISTLFPYTTLFRSPIELGVALLAAEPTNLGHGHADHADLGQRLLHVVELERRSEEHTSELQSPDHLVCRLLLEKKKKIRYKASQYYTSIGAFCTT